MLLIAEQHNTLGGKHYPSSSLYAPTICCCRCDQQGRKYIILHHPFHPQNMTNFFEAGTSLFSQSGFRLFWSLVCLNISVDRKLMITRFLKKNVSFRLRVELNRAGKCRICDNGNLLDENNNHDLFLLS